MHPIINLLRSEGYALVDFSNYYRFAAKWRNGSGLNVSVCKRSGRATDWKYGRTYSPEDLAKLIKGEIVDFGYIEEVEVTDKVKLPKKLSIETLEALMPQYDIFLNRGISKEVLEEFGCGLSHSGDMRMRVCVPIWGDGGYLAGFAGRWYKEKTPHKDVPVWKLKFKKKDIVAPSWLATDSIREKKEVIIVEGLSDVLKLYTLNFKNVICLFGIKIYPKLINYVISLDPEKIVIATNNEPDNDNIGNKAADEIKNKLLCFFDESRVEIRLPFKKDFCEMSIEGVYKWASESNL